jgi:ribokinase
MANTKKSALRTLSIGGATYDLFLTMNDMKASGEDILLKAGGKLQVDRVIESCGGGASNTSVGLSRLGMNAAFCGVVGADQWGEKLLENLKKEKVDVTSATVVEGETSSFSIVLTLAGGDRTILYTPGVNEHLHDTTFDVGAMQSVDAVYLNHLCETSCMIEDDIIAAVLKNKNVKLAWNPGGCQIEQSMHAPDKAALLKGTYLLLLNKEEALTFTKTDDVQKALTALVKAGVKNICITDGKNGTWATDGKNTYRCPILKVKAVDTTGAGDAFGTGALWALLSGNSLQEALVAGTLNAASVVGSIGAQAGLLTDTQIDQKLREHPIAVEILD